MKKTKLAQISLILLASSCVKEREEIQKIVNIYACSELSETNKSNSNCSKSRFLTTDWLRVLKENKDNIKREECEWRRNQAYEDKCITLEEKRDLEAIGAVVYCQSNILTSWALCPK